jgi:hypothetical protein
MLKTHHRNTRNMKKEGDITPPKVNPTIIDTKENEVNEILDKEFKRMIIRMINKFKDDMEKHLSEFKYNTKK